MSTAGTTINSILHVPQPQKFPLLYCCTKPSVMLILSVYLLHRRTRENRLLSALKSDFVGIAATRISAPAAGESNRGGRGALAQEDAHELVSQTVRFVGQSLRQKMIFLASRKNPYIFHLIEGF